MKALSPVDVDELLEIKTGVRRKDMVTMIRQVKLYAWEQVLLVSFYTRYQYQQKDADSNFYFLSRLRFMKWASQIKNIFPMIIAWLDEGNSYVDIIEKLKKIEDASLLLEVNSLLTRCNQSPMGFPRQYSPLVYSYASMYMAYSNIVDVFQQLLKISHEEELFDLLVLQIAQAHEHDRANFMLYRKVQLNEDKSLASILNRLPADQDVDLGRKIINEITNVLSRWASGVFDMFFYTAPKYDSWGYEISEEKNKKTIEIKQNKAAQTLEMTFDLHYIQQCTAIGQADEVMEIIKNHLNSFIAENFLKIKKQEVHGSLKELAGWYENCSVLGFRSERTIPPLVACLLDTDVRAANNYQGFLFERLGVLFQKKLKNAEAEQITTEIIDHCLVHTGKIYDFQPRNVFSVFQVDMFKASDEENSLPDSMMQVWANKDPLKRKERFKKRRNDYHAAVDSVEGKIRLQRKVAMETVFPVDGLFPFPLWNWYRRYSPSAHPESEDSYKESTSQTESDALSPSELGQ